MDTALTDRDGAYAVVRQGVPECRGPPVLGVDSRRPHGTAAATEPGRAVAHAGAGRGVPGPPTAPGHLPGRGQRGWAAICRLVPATHLTGERGSPVATLDLVAEHVAGQDVLVLLGPGSELGRATTLRRADLARAVLRPWLETVGRPSRWSRWSRTGWPAPVRAPRRTPPDGRDGPPDGLGVVLNAVRYADRADAHRRRPRRARRLVPLDLRHVDRGNAEGFLKSGKEMAEVAEEVCRLPASASPTEAPPAAHPHPGGRRPVRGRPARRPRSRRGALPGVLLSGAGAGGSTARHRRAAAGALRGRGR